MLDARTIPVVDVTAARMLDALAGDLRRRGVELLLARDTGQVRDLLRAETLDPALRDVYPSVHAAVAAASSARGDAAPPPDVSRSTFPMKGDP